MNERNAGKRRRRIYWIVGVAVGVTIALVIAFFLVTRLTAPRPDVVVTAEPKEIPAEWIQPAPEFGGDGAADVADVASIDGDLGPSETVPPQGPGSAKTAFSSSGALSFIGDGRRFGSESYRLEIDEDGVTLESSGVFEFKLLVTVRAAFYQLLAADRNLWPTAYTLDFSAPLGIRREVRAKIDTDRVLLTEGDERREVPVDPGRAFVMGTFSTYALIPALFSARQTDGSAAFDVLVFGGPPDHEGGALAEESGDLPTMHVVRLEQGMIYAGDIALPVDRYRLESALGDSLLFAREGEFLGMIAGEGEEMLFVYRSDYFPDGFGVAEDVR
jgi:hypothetical protein